MPLCSPVGGGISRRLPADRQRKDPQGRVARDGHRRQARGSAMKPVEVGQRLSFRIETEYRDTAEAFGNANVRVVGTPALVGFLETAADRCLMPCYEAKEGSGGTSIELAHLAAAPEGSIVDASAEVIGVDGRRVRFAVEARR